MAVLDPLGLWVYRAVTGNLDQVDRSDSLAYLGFPVGLGRRESVASRDQREQTVSGRESHWAVSA